MEATAVMAAVAAAADRQIQHVMIQDRSYFKSLKRNKTAGLLLNKAYEMNDYLIHVYI